MVELIFQEVMSHSRILTFWLAKEGLHQFRKLLDPAQGTEGPVSSYRQYSVKVAAIPDASHEPRLARQHSNAANRSADRTV